MRITFAGGTPTAEETAAVTATIAAIATSASPAPPPRTPAWGRAARLEATGEAPITSARDPRLHHRPSGGGSGVG